MIAYPDSLFRIYYLGVKASVVGITDDGGEAVPRVLVVWEEDLIVNFNLCLLLLEANDEHSWRVKNS